MIVPYEPRFGSHAMLSLCEELSSKQVRWAGSIVNMSSDTRLRRALQCPRYRGFFRTLRHPLLFDLPDRLRAQSAEVSAWADERGVLGMYGDIPFDYRNFGKGRSQVLFTDIIDFAEPGQEVEFRMVWL